MESISGMYSTLITLFFLAVGMVIAWIIVRTFV